MEDRMSIDENDEAFFDIPDEDPAEAVSVGERLQPIASLLHDAPEAFDNNRLERCGQWLLSIPRDDVRAMRQTPEYHEFLQAFERLGLAHRRVIATNRSQIGMEVLDDGANQVEGNRRQSASNFSFLQHLAVDDVILRVFEYLECYSLAQTSRSCSRFRELAHRSATQRTHYVANTRQLNSAMKLLRAKEQVDGVGYGVGDCHVRVPMLLLSQRILVTNTGDPEYNGVYFCTNGDGNGFVFTKPRFPEQRVVSVGHILEPPPAAPPVGLGGGGGGILPPPALALGHAQSASIAPDNEDEPHRGQLLRCVIAKRFSHETILWYMSKEVETISTETSDGEITHMFSYWAKLMATGEASRDASQYPSQTSILSRNGDPAWQSLPPERGSRPPIVELLD